MNRVGRTLPRAALCAGILTCAASCMDDELLPGTDTDGRIAFQVAESNRPVSRTVAGAGNEAPAVAAPLDMPLYVGGDTLRMTFAAEPNRGVTASSAPLTRAIPFDKDANPVQEFTVTAFRESGDPYFENLPVTVDDSRIGLTEYYWPAGNLSFCAYAGTKEFSKFDTVPDFWKTETGWAGKFSYTLPAPDAEKKKDAENQPDLVFAMKSGQQRTGAPVELLFHHALSAIVFKVGKMPDGVTLKSITLDKVYSSGTCDMTSDGEGGIDDVHFNWTLYGERTGQYTQQLYNPENKDEAGQPAEKDSPFEMKEHMFMMLPQKLTEEKKDTARLQLTFSIGEKEYTFTHPFSGIVDEWLPDTKYTFVIGLPDEIDVNVTDEVDYVTKKNVQIQNTGISTGYIRAAIVGYWVDTKTGNIVAPWNENEEGSFDWGSEWDQHWKKGEDDGFYYHLQPVKHDEYTWPLFVTYTLNDEAKKAHAGHKLVLNIVAQIVIQDKLEEAWPACPIPPQQ